MKREILFRGKRIDDNEWIEGYYVVDPKGRHRIYFQPFPDARSNTYYFVNPDTVGQFTGLLDKNGVKIFEGDIVFRSGHDVKSVIQWVDKYMCFAGIKGNDTYGFYQKIDCPFIEVIGNIHYNPELI